MKTLSMKAPTESIEPSEDWLAIVQRKVESLRFGLVQIIVHEGKVTQIESTEKTRLESRGSRS